MADKEQRRVRAARCASASFDHRGDEFPINGRFDRAAEPAALPGADPGRRLRRRARAGGPVRRRDLQPRTRRYEDGRAFYADVKGRLARYGRSPDDLKIIPAATVGARRHPGRRRGERSARSTSSRSRRRGRSPSSSRCGAATSPTYDPDGPLPTDDPDVDGFDLDHPGSGAPRQGPGGHRPDVARARRGEVALDPGAHHRGHARDARSSARRRRWPTQIDRHVQDDAADGFIFVPLPHPARARRVRRRRRARAAGPWRVPGRVRARRRCAATSTCPTPVPSISARSRRDRVGGAGRRPLRQAVGPTGRSPATVTRRMRRRSSP